VLWDFRGFRDTDVVEHDVEVITIEFTATWSHCRTFGVRGEASATSRSPCRDLCRERPGR
jgi:hypothetical protein